MKVQRRFSIRTEPDGSWTVVDVFTGLPVYIQAEPAIGLPPEQAAALVLQLNALEADRITFDDTNP